MDENGADEGCKNAAAMFYYKSHMHYMRGYGLRQQFRKQHAFFFFSLSLWATAKTQQQQQQEQQPQKTLPTITNIIHIKLCTSRA